MAVGRPRAFDTDQALERALEVFWQKGYEGTSLPDLTKAMGINRPSLYAAFGNKEALFRKALDAYTMKSESVVHDALNAPTARESVENFLKLTVSSQACAHSPKGCLLVQGALACGEEAEAIREELVARRNRMEELLRLRFYRAVDTKEIASHEDARDLAKFYATVVYGLAVQSSSGATEEQLYPVVSAALRAFPA